MKPKGLFIAILLASFAFPNIAEAQRERRRQFVEDLLEGLIDSQLDKQNESDRQKAAARPQGHDHDHDHNVRRQPLRPEQQPPEVAGAREEISHMTASLTTLVGVLEQESYSTPGYRQPLAEALHIKALTQALQQKAGYATSIDPIAEDYAHVDTKWRSLAHRLHQARGVSRRVLAVVDEVDVHNTEMSGLLRVTPQLDRAELIRLTSTLTAEFRHLQEDVSYELRRHPQHRELVSQGRDLLVAVRQSTALIDHGDYDSITAAWIQGQTGWRPYAAKLRALGNDRVRRNVMQIEQIGRQINAALWLPVPLDRDYLGQLVGSVESDIDHILASITMKDMMVCPDAPRLLATARDLQSSCASFSEVVSRADAIEDLVWDYRVFNVAWNDLTKQTQAMNNAEVQRHLVTGSESMQGLQQALGSGLELTPAEIQQIVAQMGDLCNRTALMVNRNIMTSNQYRGELRNQILTQASGLQSSMHSLHTNMNARGSKDVVRNDLNSAIRHWSALKPLMSQCQEREQQAFRQIRGDLEPLFVKMQLVYSD